MMIPPSDVSKKDLGAEERGEGFREEEASRASYVEVSFNRCSTCKHATELLANEGRLRCLQFNMLIDAEADEIPDDCPHYERAK